MGLCSNHDTIVTHRCGSRKGHTQCKPPSLFIKTNDSFNKMSKYIYGEYASQMIGYCTQAHSQFEFPWGELPGPKPPGFAPSPLVSRPTVCDFFSKPVFMPDSLICTTPLAYIFTSLYDERSTNFTILTSACWLRPKDVQYSMYHTYPWRW